MEKIFVCIPTTKERRERIKKTIASVKASDYLNIELIVSETESSGYVEAVHKMIDNFKIDGLMFILNDDMWIEPDTIIRMYQAYKLNFPSYYGIVAGNDNIQHGSLPVAPMCHSDIIKRYLYKGYTHNYSDTEMGEIMKAEKCYVVEPMAIIHHDHVTNNVTLQDETYLKAQKALTKDRELFFERKLNGFQPKNIV